MKFIVLHTARTDNSGARRNPGETVRVGDAKDQIAGDVAASLVDRGMATNKIASAAAKEASPEKVD